MVRTLAVPLGLLLAATASAAVLVVSDDSAEPQRAPAARSAPSEATQFAAVRATRPEAPGSGADAFSASKRDDRVQLTPDQIRAAEQSGLWPAGVRSLLDIPTPLTYGAYTWNDEAVPPGEISVRVDLRSQLISVFRGGHEIGTAVILYGADSHRSPEGTFPIMAKIRDHKSRTYNGAPMPYSLWLTDDGVAIHGSDVRYGAATHGCIGVPLEFAKRLFDQAGVGDRVLIVRSPPDEPETSAPA